MDRSARAIVQRLLQGSARVGSPTRAEGLLTFGAIVGMLVLTVIPWSAGAVDSWTAVRTLVLSALVLPWRTWAPTVAMLAAGAIDLWHVLSVGADAAQAESLSIALYLPAPAAAMVAAYTLGRRASPTRAWVVSVVVAASLAAAVHLAGGTPSPGLDVFLMNTVLLGTGIGAALRSREATLARNAQRRDDQRRHAVEEERLRIARELHDVLAHNLTLVNAQASVAEYLLPRDPEAAAEALRDVTAHSREALEEVRATIGVLRSPDGGEEGTRPAPSLARLEELLEDHRAAGGEVDVAVEGEQGRLGAQADAAAYRMVQEALTNARKHAPGERVRLTLTWGPGELEIVAANEAPEAHTSRGEPGFGLVGMEERARAAGGSATAERTGGGVFTVRAVLPTGVGEEIS